MICAHRWEAQPFLEELSLLPVSPSFFPFPCYSDSLGVHLIVSGQGLIRSATATAAFLSHTETRSQPLLIANFGTAGAHREQWDIGQGLILNKVSDRCSGGSLFPDRLLRHDWPEAPCLTVSRPADLGQIQPEVSNREHLRRVYDMEAYGIGAAAEQYVTTSQILLGKYVSDHLNLGAPTDWKKMAERIANGYSEAALEFLQMAQAHQQHLRSDPKRSLVRLSSEWVETTLAEVSSALTLTVSQSRNLEARLRAHALASRDHETLLPLDDGFWELLKSVEKDSSKQQNKRHLLKLLEHLGVPSLFEPET